MQPFKAVSKFEKPISWSGVHQKSEIAKELQENNDPFSRRVTFGEQHLAEFAENKPEFSKGYSSSIFHSKKLSNKNLFPNQQNRCSSIHASMKTPSRKALQAISNSPDNIARKEDSVSTPNRDKKKINLKTNFGDFLKDSNVFKAKKGNRFLQTNPAPKFKKSVGSNATPGFLKKPKLEEKSSKENKLQAQKESRPKSIFSIDSEKAVKISKEKPKQQSNDKFKSLKNRVLTQVAKEETVMANESLASGLLELLQGQFDRQINDLSDEKKQLQKEVKQLKSENEQLRKITNNLCTKYKKDSLSDYEFPLLSCEKDRESQKLNEELVQSRSVIAELQIEIQRLTEKQRQCSCQSVSKRNIFHMNLDQEVLSHPIQDLEGQSLKLDLEDSKNPPDDAQKLIMRGFLAEFEFKRLHERIQTLEEQNSDLHTRNKRLLGIPKEAPPVKAKPPTKSSLPVEPCISLIDKSK